MSMYDQFAAITVGTLCPVCLSGREITHKDPYSYIFYCVHKTAQVMRTHSLLDLAKALKKNYAAINYTVPKYVEDYLATQEGPNVVNEFGPVSP